MRGLTIGLATAGVAATLAVSAGTASAGSGDATFNAICDGYTLTLQTGINSSPLLTVVGAEPRVNAVIKYEQAYDPNGALIFSKSVDGFSRNSQGVVNCQMTSPQGPYAGYLFDVGFHFTPAG